MKLKIIENFLNLNDLEELSSLQLNHTEKNCLNVYHNEINKKDEIKNDCVKKNTIKRLHKNYHLKAIEILKELNPLKTNLYDYSEFHIIETGADYKFPIHDDTPNKLLSGVVYLKPKYNNGTIFYNNKKGDGKKEIEWKINRAVFFSRSERESWHSYQGDGKSNRVVLVYNLMTSRIKEVYKIEKKNYFYGNLRYKLNPFIYRFFKKTF
jgi:hypothetical protein